MRNIMIPLLVLTARSLTAQTDPNPAPSFDIASVKPAVAGSREGMTIQPGGRLVVNALSLRVLISFAWRLRAYQMAGGENWMSDEKWSIEAKIDEPSPDPEAFAIRLQSLLIDRFGLKTHRETRELAIYALSAAKGGTKLLPADQSSPPGALRAGPGIMMGSNVTLQQTVAMLDRLMDRPVIDKTGLSGNWKVNLQFDPASSPRPAFGATPASASQPEGVAASPSIFAAIQEQLGLKLEPAKEPVEVLVIDSAHKPTEN